MLNGMPAALGTAKFGTLISQQDSFRILSKYASLGGRIIDTANNYAYWEPESKGQGGDSEKVIGEWLNKENRNQFTIMTKIGSQPFPNDKGEKIIEGLSPEAVNSAVDKSLARLQIECIDILFTHHDDRNTPLLDTWKALSSLVDAGKVKKLGISNYIPKRVSELVNIINENNLAPVDYVQLRYSLIAPLESADFDKLVVLDQKMKNTLKKLLSKAVIFVYSPLLRGLYERNSEKDWSSDLGKMYDSVQNRGKVNEIQHIAKKRDVSPSAYVLKTIFTQGYIPITSTSNIERLETNLELLKDQFLKK